MNPDSTPHDDPFARGIRLFNSREFFEAHEAWEMLWLPAPEPDKTFLQGIIQVAAAFFHFFRGNRVGAESLLRRGRDKLAQFPSDYRGLRLDELRGELHRWHAALLHGTARTSDPPPRIRLR